jgi:hypothetical protein|tara:strand:+ start:576 stop:767 length:192 start_codon:yes stop_codon:yes gene_type:complete
MSVSFLFSVFLVVPKCLGLLDVFGLAFLRAATEQNNKLVVILAKIDAIAWAEADAFSKQLEEL